MFVVVSLVCLLTSGATPGPDGALLRSALVPGWGQWANGHPLKGLILEAMELTFAGMALGKPGRDTFVLLWLGTRLYGMADAYVDAHLRNFDKGEDLKVREGKDVEGPGGGKGGSSEEDKLRRLQGLHSKPRRGAHLRRYDP